MWNILCVWNIETIIEMKCVSDIMPLRYQLILNLCIDTIHYLPIGNLRIDILWQYVHWL